MFGYVTANLRELTKEQQKRYGAVYCGICRRIREQSGQLARLGLSYDMAFLALLLMSLYEPEEMGDKNSCLLHPLTRREWVDGPYIRYAADMNVALAYYNCLDDWQDDGKKSAKWMADRFAEHQLEAENCPNPDEPAGAFGELMGELFYVREDMWTDTLRQMGNALGRFVYLLDAELDYDKDKKQGKYNPFLAKGEEKNLRVWEDYLVLTMGRCTENFEKLPLVQDKALLDNILYSGVWVSYHRGKKKEEEGHD